MKQLSRSRNPIIQGGGGTRVPAAPAYETLHSGCTEARGRGRGGGCLGRGGHPEMNFAVIRSTVNLCWSFAIIDSVAALLETSGLCTYRVSSAAIDNSGQLLFHSAMRGKILLLYKKILTLKPLCFSSSRLLDFFDLRHNPSTPRAPTLFPFGQGLHFVHGTEMKKKVQ